MTSLDNRFLISLVKAYPQLWDRKNVVLYSDKQAKCFAWQRISEDIDPLYMKRSPRQRDSFVLKIRSKWKTLRDNYTRYIRRQTSNNTMEMSKPYLYAKEMHFILDSIGESRSVLRLSDNVCVDIEDFPNATSSSPEHSLSSDQIRQRLVPKIEATDEEENPLEYVGMDERDQETLDIPGMSSVLNLANSLSPGLAFFQSLQPAIDTFTVDEQLDFQTEVLNVVKGIRAKRKMDQVAKRRREQARFSDFGTDSAFNESCSTQSD